EFPARRQRRHHRRSGAGRRGARRGSGGAGRCQAARRRYPGLGRAREARARFLRRRLRRAHLPAWRSRAAAIIYIQYEPDEVAEVAERVMAVLDAGLREAHMAV
ncbi:MAG: hypothetical protein AVDCRST_MAG39-1583, partial [uncultured Sphingomonadaceae bacterium]